MRNVVHILYVAAWSLLMSSCGSDEGEIKGEKPVVPVKATEEEELRSAIVSYMIQPRFAPPDMMEQVCGAEGKAWLDRHSERLYLVFPREHFDTTAVLSHICRYPDSVAFGENLFSALPTAESNPKKEVIFAFPWQHFNETGFKGLHIPVGKYEYELSPEELVEFTTHRCVYGGRVDIITAEAKDAPLHLIANHGILIARKGEPSLNRLLGQLDLESLTNEQKAQRILDLVTQNLKYLDSDATGSVETLKKPHEVLFTGGSDCSGLTVLYASLLEQTGVDYRLVYCKEHITVGVAGDFPNENKMRFKLGGKMFTIAEATVPGFEIGKTLINPAITPTSVRYYQDPGENAEILDYMTGEPLKFGRVVMKPR